MKTKKLIVSLLALFCAMLIAVSGMSFVSAKAEEPSLVVTHSIDTTTGGSGWEGVYGNAGYLLFTASASGGTGDSIYTKGLFGEEGQLLSVMTHQTTPGEEITSPDAFLVATSIVSRIGTGKNQLWRAWKNWPQGIDVYAKAAENALKIPAWYNAGDEYAGKTISGCDLVFDPQGATNNGNKYTGEDGMTDKIEASCGPNGGTNAGALLFSLNEETFPEGSNVKVTAYVYAAETLFLGCKDRPEVIRGWVDNTAITYNVELYSGLGTGSNKLGEEDRFAGDELIDTFEVNTTRDGSFYVTFTINQPGDYVLRLWNKNWETDRVDLVTSNDKPPYGSFAGLFFDVDASEVTKSITYVLDGGTNGANPTEYVVGTGVASLANATKEGYTFDGWYTDSSFTTKVTSIPTTADGDIVLYAKFTKITEPSPDTDKDVEEEKSEGGCGSVIGSTLALISLVSLGAGAVVISRKKEN